jgi:hypothetical protein
MVRMTAGGFQAAVKNSLFAVNTGDFLRPTLEPYRPFGKAYCGVDATYITYLPLPPKKLKLSPCTLNKIIWGSGGSAPLILNLGII